MHVSWFFVFASTIGWLGCTHAEPPPEDASSVAATARVEFEQAWSNADVELTASWFM